MQGSQCIAHVILEAPTMAEDSRIVSQKSNFVIAEGTLQDLYSTNRNRRNYDDEVKKQLTCERTIELLESGNMWGELGHPTDQSLARQSQIDPKVCCVRFLKLWAEGNKIKGQFKGTNNVYGEQFNADLLDGIKPSFSLRALGSIENRNGKAWVKNVKLITYDRVIYPSHKCAYTTGIVEESCDITGKPAFKNNVYMEEDSNGILIPVTNSNIVDYIKQESANIKTIMNNFDTIYDSISMVMENGSPFAQMTDVYGNVFRVRLETQIKNDIMNYCYNG